MNVLLFSDRMDAPQYSELKSTSFNIILNEITDAVEYYIDLAERHSSRVLTFRVSRSGETVSMNAMQ